MRALAFQKAPLIGMIHLPPLPGAPRYGGSMRAVSDRAVQDAANLTAAGVDAVMVENFGDVPFPRGPSAPETVAAMAAIVERVVEATPLPVGVNVLRNDGIAALGVAVATGASFIRVNVLAWARLTDQGIVEGAAAELLRRRAALGAAGVRILADVAVKHSAPLAELPVEAEAQDVVKRALADAVVVTGDATGGAVDFDHLERVVSAVDAPVLAGSGVTPRSASRLRAACSGAIVGSAMMRGGRAGGPVSLSRARKLVGAWNAAG